MFIFKYFRVRVEKPQGMQTHSSPGRMFVSVMPSHGGTHARFVELRYKFKELKAPKPPPPPPPKKKLKKKRKKIKRTFL